jgi:hypothetical protein
VKIKFEVDTQPPLGFDWEEKLYLRPVPYMVRSMTLPSLFAGKMHALLCRGWENRPKGRDWYDLTWYVAQQTPLDLHYLRQRLRQSCSVWERQGRTPPEFLDRTALLTMLHERIETLDIEMAREDVVRFIKDPGELRAWSPAYFRAIAESIVVTDDEG